MGDQDSLRRTGEDGKVKFGRMLSRHPTGGRARLFDGLASLTKEEKVRLSSREALAASEVRLILVSWVVEPRRWWTEG